uniref:competence protein n=1 Tax=Flavobacterium sp. TaxID=239 RepID=UPI004049E6D9
MAFNELNENINEIQESTKAYIDSSVAYYKLWGFKVAMKSTTMIIKFSLIALFLLIFLLFVSIAGSLFLGELVGNIAIGFLIVAGVYLVLAFLLFFVKDRIIEGPILERFSEIFFND